MKKKTRRERITERLKLLADITHGRKHTHSNAVLAPLSQADIVNYETSGAPYYRITKVWLTDNGKSYMEFYAKEYGVDIT